MRLDLDPGSVLQARALAAHACQPVLELAQSHTTVSVERAVLRMAGLEGADAEGTPWVNLLVDSVAGSVGLERGVALPVWDALAARRRLGLSGPGAAASVDPLLELAQDAAAGSVTWRVPTGRAAGSARTAALRAARQGVRRIDQARVVRDRMLRRYPVAGSPLIYLIVATGDIYEDVPQAQAAARAGADVIAVIRSTGQSLLDFVPEGATREGYAGTYATAENFRIMRAALDDVSRELGRYVRLTNYASGLCMPEIATLAGLARLDMMLNDSMYGILFRDINPVRTFVDQHFARQVHARAGIIINTGEDNYLTTADAVEAAHTVTVSQLINEHLAHAAGLADWQLGLGHAFEINPDLPDSFRLELAHALLARSLFPDAPLKWMPPTKHMTGDIFRGYLLDGFFNLAGMLTGQGILLVGMMTEAVVTPWLSDRDLALQNVAYVRNAVGALADDFQPAADGFIATRARIVLDEAVALLGRISDEGLLAAIGDGTFGLMRRPADGGRGLDGVVARAPEYLNPVTEVLTTTAGSGSGSGRACGCAGERVSRVIRPYGDATGDGMVQLSFTLPVSHDKRAEGAAAQLAATMGIDPAMVVHAKAMGPDFTFFVVYGRVNHLIELDKVTVVERDFPLLTPREVNTRIRKRLRRPLVIVGACIGTDAHTVGIDAILNIKGFAGEKGLEYYSGFAVHNLGAQVSVPALVDAATRHRADAVLVSQVVTQRDAHLHNAEELTAAFREAFPAARRPVVVLGGPRFDESAAADLGVDRIFGRGTTPGEVASYLVHRLVKEDR